MNKRMRIFIVSNRLPITAVKGNKLDFKESVGGLVSGLSSYIDSLKGSSLNYEFRWIGWPGITISDDQKNVLKLELENINTVPVFLTEEVMEKYYLGFCNKTIWPLFHYFNNYVSYNGDYWNCYKYVNQIFCDTVLEVVQPGDIIWIHDYHLMLLPKLLRDKLDKKCKISFFLHIPFPFFEIFTSLPKAWRRDILEGMLGSDLIGFHTGTYVKYFLDCVYKILGHGHYMGNITLEDRVVNIDAFPMGIQFDKFNKTDIKKIEEFKTLSDYKVILSIDRLDYTKGLANKLSCYELFLEKHKELHKKLIFVLIVVPSRIGVDHYEMNKKVIDETVGRINGKYGNISWTPILYQFKFLPFEELLSLYRSSDVALITPLRDGMNLIAKEYVASRKDKTGVLILSEMAGVSEELNEAIIVNPNDKEEIERALITALEMDVTEQKRRNKIMQKHLQNYDVSVWANSFIDRLLLSDKK
ncbi:MAG: bifunctional alpha,alpha-trehalose-phosphate synthase (UDP-forming)/trehalose-phosphatase [Candidatus Methanoperedens sp.]|nr:bifunctional alpha,alpha-trehalose-phosphate synthase (UDP-forming)/trehalose-phosphatase [Candidatus Methanoperedens sp.]